MQTAWQTLSPELLDLIVQHHIDDHPSLYTSSLVCRNWNQATRYHIFGRVRLLLGRCERLETFIALVRHPKCTFAAHNGVKSAIRELSLVPPNLDGEEITAGMRGELEELARLAGARSLTIYYPRLMPAICLTVLTGAFQGIQKLAFKIRFSTLADGIRFACSFDGLEELGFDAVRAAVGEYPGEDLVMPQGLKKLTLCSLRGHEVWFADKRVASLTELALHNIHPIKDAGRLDLILATLGAQLKSLTIIFAAQKGDLEIQTDLSPLTALRYLELDVSSLSRKSVLQALLKLPTPVTHLESLTWRARRSSFEGLSAEHWTSLDNLLANGTAFPALQKIDVTASTGGKYDVTEKLNKCAARKILSQ
ncbi:unnamed protein product [Mycena citricolor]|uniref:F-box domain-containing protein n=1 Tax=Mycena citricolor TaxID=2018698 RepID=A0AAD2H1X3_9AGAR|nr:unnamed protein product [Mycena citricolor]